MHHHGAGHANRTRLLAAGLPAEVPVHVFTSSADAFADWERGTVHPLPPDTEADRDPARDLLADRILHYAPVDMPGLQQRMAILSAFIAAESPALFVVDLSVEVALFTRLCGARTALMRLHGLRDDPAHLAAFGLADRLLAPFPAALEDAHTPDWIREKTTYLGAFSRYDGRRESRGEARAQLDLSATERVVTVITGRGGGAQVSSGWGAIAAATPAWTFLLVGEFTALGAPPPNLRAAALQSDTFPYLRAADVVVGSGGTNTMFEIGAARVPYLSVPEPRPFDEQLYKVRALERLGLTRVLTDLPPPEQWAGLLEAARNQPTTGWDGLFATPAARLI